MADSKNCGVGCDRPPSDEVGEKETKSSPLCEPIRTGPTFRWRSVEFWIAISDQSKPKPQNQIEPMAVKQNTKFLAAVHLSRSSVF